MADKQITALIVPQGKILDFIDNKLRKETPEEYVRQEIEKSPAGFLRSSMQTNVISQCW